MQLAHKAILGKAGLALALLPLCGLAATQPASAQTLTGSVLFSADSAGNFIRPDVWTTSIAATSYVKLWTYQGTTLVSASATDPTLNFALTPGTYTFGIYGSPGSPLSFQGMNLFFDGQTNPGISVKANTLNSVSDTSVFTADNGSTITPTVAAIPGAGTLSFVDGTTTVQLTAFSWAAPDVYNMDRVSQFTATPDGTSDLVGSYTLKVTNSSAVPEASTTVSFGLLLCLGLGGVAWSARRKKAQAGE